jgi:hypothetical protein
LMRSELALIQTLSTECYQIHSSLVMAGLDPAIFFGSARKGFAGRTRE